MGSLRGLQCRAPWAKPNAVTINEAASFAYGGLLCDQSSQNNTNSLFSRLVSAVPSVQEGWGNEEHPRSHNAIPATFDEPAVLMVL
mgnify:CR=1 FL=1